MGIDIGASLKSAMNFMTPGIGAIHQDNGKPPIGAAPGLGTTNFGAKFEQGLASKLSGMFGSNVGAISADSYVGKPTSVPQAGLAALNEEDVNKPVGAMQNTPTGTAPVFTAM